MSSTIIDIAKKAGVSPSTVSRVINNYPYVKDSTKKRVLEIIKELNYSPDLIARSMVKGRTFNIGLIIGDLTNHLYAETAGAIVKAAEKYNCHVTLCVKDETPDKFQEYVELLITKRVDGIIIGSITEEDSLDRLISSKVPFVLYNRKHSVEDIDYIIQEDFKGAYEAVTHLIQLGHKKIGMIHGPTTLNTVQERSKGYMKALESHKIKHVEGFVQSVNYNDREKEIEVAMDKIFENSVKPTAIFTTADFLALDVMEYVLRKGYEVPEDIALIGFDNARLSGHRLIGLSTVGHRVTDMAKLAVERLMQKIELLSNGEERLPPWKIILQPELVIRQTCGYHQKSQLSKL